MVKNYKFNLVVHHCAYVQTISDLKLQIPLDFDNETWQDYCLKIFQVHCIQGRKPYTEGQG